MIRERTREDPASLRRIQERLAYVLDEAGPRRAARDGGSGGARAEDLIARAARHADPGSERRDEGDSGSAHHADGEPVQPRRRTPFGRMHLGVVTGLLILALVFAAMAVLRARPVAVASPVDMTSPARATASATRSPPAGRISSGSGAVPTSAGSGGTVPASSGLSGATAGSTASSATVRIVVHVFGAVRRPGLVRLPEHARVQDAIDTAGGLLRTADPGELNLAQVLADGQQILIGTKGDPRGEVRDTGGVTGGSGSPDGSGGSGGSGGAAAEGLVDLNSATAAQLDALPGVGPVTAGKIIAWRTEHRRFGRVEELQEVDGIGPKTYAQIAPHVRL